jgi:hypothetical protein
MFTLISDHNNEADILRTTQKSAPNLGAYKPQACESYFGGWQEKTVSRNGREKSLFAGIISWRGVEPKRRWYNEFAARAHLYGSYGHKVDALRIITDRDIESRFVNMEREDEEVIRCIDITWSNKSVRIPRSF